MAKITLGQIGSGYASTAALNSLIQQVEAALDQSVLWRNPPQGEPNSMEADIDMDGNDILNANLIFAQDFRIDGQSLNEIIDAAVAATIAEFNVIANAAIAAANAAATAADGHRIEANQAVEDAEFFSGIAEQEAGESAQSAQEAASSADDAAVAEAAAQDVLDEFNSVYFGVRTTEPTPAEGARIGSWYVNQTDGVVYVAKSVTVVFGNVVSVGFEPMSEGLIEFEPELDVAHLGYEALVDDRGALSNSPRNMRFLDSGTRVVALVANNAFMYALSTPWDLSTSVLTSQAALPSPRAMHMTEDGTTLTIIVNGTQTILAIYNLTTPYDLSTLTPVYSDSLSFAGNQINGVPFAMDWSSDGLHLAVGTVSGLYFADFSTPYAKVAADSITAVRETGTDVGRVDAVSIIDERTYLLGRLGEMYIAANRDPYDSKLLDITQSYVFSDDEPSTFAYGQYEGADALYVVGSDTSSKIRVYTNLKTPRAGIVSPELPEFGNAAFLDTGTDPGDVPRNQDLGSAALLDAGTGPGDLPRNQDLGTAALLDAGTNPGDLPRNQDLGSAALLDTGTNADEVPTNADLPVASTTKAGLVELATQGEVDEGIAADKAVTPGTLAEYGTWVPTIVASGAAIEEQSRVGTYYKIGRLVVANYRLLCTTPASVPVGSVATLEGISGLPYPVYTHTTAARMSVVAVERVRYSGDGVIAVNRARPNTFELYTYDSEATYGRPEYVAAESQFGTNVFTLEGTLTYITDE